MELSELDSLLASAKQPETTVTLCLRADLQAEWEQLDRELTDLRARASRKLAGSNDEVELARQVQAVEEEMAASTITVTLRALTRRPWMQLVQSHPPRKDNEGDKQLGINQDTFFDALIGACVVDPELDEERLTGLLDALTSHQFDQLTEAAWSINRQDVSVPFSPIASRIITSSGGTSRRQSGSGSRTKGSQGGNQKQSRSTSTTKKAD